MKDILMSLVMINFEVIMPLFYPIFLIFHLSDFVLGIDGKISKPGTSYRL